MGYVNTRKALNLKVFLAKMLLVFEELVDAYL